MAPVRRRGVSLLAAAVLLPALAAVGFLAGAGAAAADDAAPRHQSGAVAVLDSLKTFDTAVLHANGEDQKLQAGLFEMTVEGGGTLKTYCVDLHNPSQSQARYLETPWHQTSLGGNKNAGRIGWILQHSYPQTDDLAALARRAGTGPLTEKTAAAGTQVAIWRYSDGADVDASDPQAEKLADWLQKSARTVAEPPASLTLEPAAVSGRAGERLGPVTVRTGASRVTVTPRGDAVASGVRITDKAGNPVTTVVSGAQLYFDVPAGTADGSAALGVLATTSVPVGRAFSSTTRSQTQIIAGSSDSTVSGTATANWAGAGAIPAFTAAKNCAARGVDVTVDNQGDQEFAFELAGGEHTVAAGGSRTLTVPVDEDQAYDITVTGPGGFAETFRGILDCATAGSPAPVTAEPPSAQPGAASAGGLSVDGAPGLAETGSSNVTPVIAGIAVALVVLGGVAVLLLRKKKPVGGGE